MSLIVDGIWKAGVWATTVWADGVWREGAPTPPAPTPGHATGGGGGAFFLHDAGARRRKKDRDIRNALEAAFDVFNEAPAAIVDQVREIVAPVAETTGPRAAPRIVVDVAALERSAERVAQLLALAEREEARRRFDEEDEADVEFMLRYG